jgi:hypothetical protein
MVMVLVMVIHGDGDGNDGDGDGDLWIWVGGTLLPISATYCSHYYSELLNLFSLLSSPWELNDIINSHWEYE